MIDIEKKTKIKLLVKLLIYLKETITYSKNRKIYSKNLKQKQQITKNSYVKKLLSIEETSSKAFDKYFMEKIFNQLCHDGEASKDCSEYYKIFNIIKDDQENSGENDDIYNIIQTIINEVNEFHEINNTSIEFKKFRYNIYKYARDKGLHKKKYDKNDIDELSKYIKDEFSKIFDKVDTSKSIDQLELETTEAKNKKQESQTKLDKKQREKEEAEKEITEIRTRKDELLKQLDQEQNLPKKRNIRNEIDIIEEEESKSSRKLIEVSKEFDEAKIEKLNSDKTFESINSQLETSKAKQKYDQDIKSAEEDIFNAKREIDASNKLSKQSSKKPESIKREIILDSIDRFSKSSDKSHNEYRTFISDLYSSLEDESFDDQKILDKKEKQDELNKISLLLLKEYFTSKDIKRKEELLIIFTSLKEKYNQIYKSIK